MILHRKHGVISMLLIFIVTCSAWANGFILFDGTAYKDKPDLAQYEVAPITIIYVSQLWPDWHKGGDRDALPHRERVQAVARKAGKTGNPIVLDIEHWRYKGEDLLVAESVEKYKTVLRWFKEAAPGVSLGLYMVLPIRDYWRAIKGAENTQYKDWVKENDKLRVLSNYVDVIYPSIYTFYSDRSGWVKYAKAQIAEARKYGKPVVAFLWPQYHNSNSLLGGKPIPRDYWRLQLDTMKEYADGVVIWSGNKQSWDDSAEWWQEALDFMNTPVR